MVAKRKRTAPVSSGDADADVEPSIGKAGAACLAEIGTVSVNVSAKKGGKKVRRAAKALDGVLSGNLGELATGQEQTKGTIGVGAAEGEDGEDKEMAVMVAAASSETFPLRNSVPGRLWAKALKDDDALKKGYESLPKTYAEQRKFRPSAMGERRLLSNISQART